MMSGCGILTNGKGTRREYGQYNLDALAVSRRYMVFLSISILSSIEIGKIFVRQVFSSLKQLQFINILSD